MKGSVNIVKARPEHAEDIADLFDEVYEGNYSRPDMTNPAAIANDVTNPHKIWYVGEHRGADGALGVVSSGIAKLHTHNRSVEYASAATRRSFRKRGVQSAIFSQCRRDTRKWSPNGEWAFMRDLSSRRICEGTLGQLAVGYAPGIHLVGEREVHLRGFWLSETARQERVSAQDNPFYGLTGIQQINERLGLVPNPGPYPSTLFSYPPIGGSDSVQQTVMFESLHDQRELSLTIVGELFGNLKDVEYIEATVLIDKIPVILGLERIFGLEMVAYLPAWHNGYDCVVMARSIVPPVFADGRFRQTVGKFQRGFDLLPIKDLLGYRVD